MQYIGTQPQGERKQRAPLDPIIKVTLGCIRGRRRRRRRLRQSHQVMRLNSMLNNSHQDVMVPVAWRSKSAKDLLCLE